MIFIQRQDNKTQVHHETIYVVSSVLYPSAFYIFFSTTKNKQTTVKRVIQELCGWSARRI